MASLLFEDSDDPTFEGEEAQDLGLWLPPESDDWSNISEIEAKNWRDYTDISTNSLWIIGARSRDGVHTGKYHGNFVPQIPYQVLRRFTKPGDVVLDTFLGSGTTLVECRRLGRNGIGIELSHEIAADAQALIEQADNPHATWQTVIQGDSTERATIEQVRQQLAAHQRDKVQLLVMHPPYHDIIKFSDNDQDLSNAQTVAAFTEAFKKIVHLTYDLLAQNHFLVVVIGDKYSDKEWIPLGFHTMAAVQSAGYALKSIVVKNMEGNRAKRNVQNLWRQRAFKGDWYIFKHEYIFFFQKSDKIVEPLEKVINFVLALDEREKLDLIQSRASLFASGEALNRHLGAEMTYASISPPCILVLKVSGRIRAVVINLIDVNLTPTSINELRDLLDKLPDTVIDISVLADDDKKDPLQNLGISQVYGGDEKSLEQLAHALYVIRKATGAGQRAGRTEATAFTAQLNQAIAAHFEPGNDYVWRKRGPGVRFRFFKRTPEKDFDETDNGLPNFLVGLETNWLSGHEKERACHIGASYCRKGYQLIAVVGHNAAKWETLIREQGHFADYYLLLDKTDRESVADIVINRPLLRAGGKTALETTDESLVTYLKRLQPQE